jgi:hypothetical protein
MDILLLFYSKICSFCSCFFADVIAYTTHVPSFADTWGLGYGNQKKKKNEIKLLLLCNLVVINHFYKCLYYLYYALNPGFRPTIIHWFCGNGHKNQRKNKWGIALSNW